MVACFSDGSIGNLQGVGRRTPNISPSNPYLSLSSPPKREGASPSAVLVATLKKTQPDGSLECPMLFVMGVLKLFDLLPFLGTVLKGQFEQVQFHFGSCGAIF